MGLLPTRSELIARARADLRMGLPVVLSIGPRAGLIAAAETLSAERLADLRALGEPVLVITERRASTLKARAYSDDIARITLPEAADTRWIRDVIDPARDLVAPLKGPLVTRRGGDETLAAAAVRLAKAAQLLPAALVVDIADGAGFAAGHGLTHVALEQPEEIGAMSELAPVAGARVPLAAARAGRVVVYRPEDGGVEHYAIEIGRPDRARPVLVRLHSACFTGDVLGSLKCDCGPQLNAALQAMGREGAGVLLYLNQEGRGIGLANKMRAYSLQDQGFDTVEANHRLGFEDDERDFRIGAEMLKSMGFSSVRLMTNNPAKIARMQANGIRVAERVPLRVGRSADNAAYLDTKASKSGHLM